MQKLKEELKSFRAMMLQPTTITNYTQNNNIFVLNDWRYSSVEPLSIEEIIQLLCKDFVNREILDLTYFNPHKPENHSIVVANIKTAAVLFYESGTWKRYKISNQTNDGIIDEINDTIMPDIRRKMFHYTLQDSQQDEIPHPIICRLERLKKNKLPKIRSKDILRQKENTDIKNPQD